MGESVLRNPVYELFGVQPVINAGGTHTTHGGSRMHPEVLQAMADASRSYVPVVELNRKVGEFIAQVTGAEGGMVTCGAASGIVLAAAACITGTDVAKIRRLPDTEGMRNEIVMQLRHYGVYGNTHSFAGGRVVLAGDAVSCVPEELEAAITSKTAAVAFLFAPGVHRGGISLPQAAEIAHGRGVPVMVDAAAMLPPKDNLRRFIREGADLVVFSGGKFIGGPQATGILAGRKDLIESALMNNSPHHAIGRPQKVAREEIIGLATALRLYVDSDEETFLSGLRKKAEWVADGLEDVSAVRVSVRQDEFRYFVPTAVVELNGSGKIKSAAELSRALHEGDPRIYVALGGASNAINVNPFNLQDGEEDIVARRVGEELGAS